MAIPENRNDKIASEDPADHNNPDSEYNIEDDEEKEYEELSDENPKPGTSGFGRLFVLMIKLLASPRVVWREIRRIHVKADTVCRNLFYPLIGLAAASNFINLKYDPDATVSQEIVAAVITFASFFFGYFLVFLFGKMLLKGVGKTVIQSEFGKEFVAFAMSTLTLFYILYCVLPMLEPIIVLLPLWTIFAVTRGIKILRIPEEDTTSATVWISLLIIGCPILVAYVFDMFL